MNNKNNDCTFLAGILFFLPFVIILFLIFIKIIGIAEYVLEIKREIIAASLFLFLIATAYIYKKEEDIKKQ